MLVLMCTYNGARYLPQQLDSLAAQSHVRWSLWVSDDGSSDATREILETFARTRAGRNEVRIVEGPRQGAARNFLSLLAHRDLPLGPDVHVALSDQDDIWFPDKLAWALERLTAAADRAEGGPRPPLVYGAQSLRIDERGRRIGRPLPGTRVQPLATSLVQNGVSGHTLTLNPEALALVRRAGAVDVAFHDWWISLLVQAAGGGTLLDERLVAFYRQHGTNAIGAPQGLAAQIRRGRLMLSRRYADWIGANLAALSCAPVPLTPEAEALIEAFSAPAASGPARLRQLRRLGIRRRGRIGTALLHCAALLQRV